MDQPGAQERIPACADVHWLCYDMDTKPGRRRELFPDQVGCVSCLFPPRACSVQSLGKDFPQGFPTMIQHVYRQLLRVFAHIYHAHYPQILHLRSEPHFNSLFAHFLAFGREYALLDIKDVMGTSSAPVGVGALWEKWKEMGLLEK